MREGKKIDVQPGSSSVTSKDFNNQKNAATGSGPFTNAKKNQDHQKTQTPLKKGL